MRVVLLLLLAFVSNTLSLTYERVSPILNYEDPKNARELYEQFKRDYNKTTPNEEDEVRFLIFKDNLMFAEFYNVMEQGTAKYGITQFSDLTVEEFTAKLANAKLNEQAVKNAERLPSNGGGLYNESVDWRDFSHVVGPVKQQGSCGSCWAFSVAGNIESQLALQSGYYRELSKQQIVDCDRVDAGCHGGLPEYAYKEIQRMGGLQLEKDYPYKAQEGQCLMNPDNVVAKVKTFAILPENEMDQANHLYTHGPLSVALNANLLQFYLWGISHPWHFLCNPNGLNHAVLTVGYGTEMGKDFWIVKNSWGENWGEKGYFRMYRGDGTCGINKYVSTAYLYSITSD